MREIDAGQITRLVKQLAIDASYHLPRDVEEALAASVPEEHNPLAQDILQKTLDNAAIARQGQYPICQDTGMAVVFLEIGQEVHIRGNLSDAVNEGVRQGYAEGYLRKSVLKDPLLRENTGDNTPSVIHYNIVSGDRLRLTFLAKGFGSENMSRIGMLKPADDAEGVVNFVVDTVRLAGGNPCPPVIVGIGLGGTFEKAALLSKQALTLDTQAHHPDPFYAEMEQTILEKLNALDIGPQGFGGRTTALAAHILTYPTHIAGLPVAVNVSCYVSRHRSAEL